MSRINGVNCIVDTNYILYKNVYTLVKYKTLYGDLERSLEVSFENFLNRYPFRKIYMVCDSKESWRKEIYSEYKSHRKEIREKEEIDWEFVFNTFDNFKEKLINPRIKYLEQDGLEGDDIITKLVRNSNNSGLSTVIIASDGDLNQLLEYSLVPNKSYINIQWRENYTNGKIYVPEGYKLFINALRNDKGDIFNQNENSDFLSFYDELSEKEVVEEVDIQKMLFLKIISGDTGDNINSVLQIPMKTDATKLRGIGEAGAKKIWEEFKSNYPNDIDFIKDDWIKNVVEYVASNKKVEVNEYKNVIIENIKLNRRLIHLHENHLPFDIKEKVDKI